MRITRKGAGAIALGLSSHEPPFECAELTTLSGIF